VAAWFRYRSPRVSKNCSDLVELATVIAVASIVVPTWWESRWWRETRTRVVSLRVFFLSAADSRPSAGAHEEIPMEVFVDFGLFELFTVLGFSVLARNVYSRRLLRVFFLVASMALPCLLVVLADTERLRWLAAACLVTVLINLSVVLGALQQGKVPTFSLTRTANTPDRLRTR
jgi:hypothetical protein